MLNLQLGVAMILYIKYVIAGKRTLIPEQTKNSRIHPRSLTARPSKMVVGRRSFPIGFRELFRGKLAVKLQVGFFENHQHLDPKISKKSHLVLEFFAAESKYLQIQQ